MARKGVVEFRGQPLAPTARFGPMDDGKQTLHRYLQVGRDAVLWKVEGLSEHDARRPLTSTGTSMLGIVTHLAWVDVGYFGACFDRPFPEPDSRGWGRSSSTSPWPPGRSRTPADPAPAFVCAWTLR